MRRPFGEPVPSGATDFPAPTIETAMLSGILRINQPSFVVFISAEKASLRGRYAFPGPRHGPGIRGSCCDGIAPGSWTIRKPGETAAVAFEEALDAATRIRPRAAHARSGRHASVRCSEAREPVHAFEKHRRIEAGPPGEPHARGSRGAAQYVEAARPPWRLMTRERMARREQGPASRVRRVSGTQEITVASDNSTVVPRVIHI